MEEREVALEARADEHLVVRPGLDSDVEGILDMLEPMEFIKPLTREQLRQLFTYQWTKRPNVGIVLVDGSVVVGLEARVYSPPRTFDGIECTLANLTTAVIDPKYRTRRTETGVVRYSLEIIKASIGLGYPTTVFSARGPNDVVPKLLMRMGFEQLSSADLFFVLGSAPATLARPAGRVYSDTDVVRNQLDPAQRQILDDHRPYGCRFLLIRDGDRSCFVVTKRRRYRGEWLWPSLPATRIRRRSFPVSDLLHVSDPDVAKASWGRLVWHACVVDRAVGLTCTESFLGSAATGGTKIPQRIFMHGRTIPERLVDKLYSELVLLP